jgi:hypothetical protein
MGTAFPRLMENTGRRVNAYCQWAGERQRGKATIVTVDIEHWFVNGSRF